MHEEISIILLGSSEKTIRIMYGSTLTSKPYIYSIANDNFMKYNLIEEKPRVYFLNGDKIEEFIDIDESNVDTIISKIQSRL